MNYAVVDIETTGGSPRSSKITEIAIYIHDGEKIIDEFSSLVNPEMKIPEFIVNLTGITDHMVADAPKFHEIAKKIVQFTEDCVFVAHNVGFDYGITRQEFKNLGYDYRRPHLCTVRASRYILPGLESYSLGKLTRNLGIPITNRHRAGGDAFATAHLFTLLNNKSHLSIEKFIQHDINPSILHPNLDLEDLEALPSKTGVYQFYGELNELLYIGKSINIKKRVNQHLRNTKTKKGSELLNKICRIEYKLTGSELIALLEESRTIKEFKPKFNNALKKNKFPFGLFSYTDDVGYIRFYIELTSKKTDIPLTSFTTKREGVAFLTEWTEKYTLCQKLNDLYQSKNACFHYGIKQCNGACINKEETITYNQRTQDMVAFLNLNEETFYIIENGPQKSEKALVLVENGILVGYGFAPYHFHKQPVLRWKRYIDPIKEDRDSKTILGTYLRKNSQLSIVKF
ncbi:MAG: GIY-YIG nuclease family protein [Bacteroidetes bacterium]|nr:GIY-YIG nuclease family protein [Bacteroidota bacterium]